MNIIHILDDILNTRYISIYWFFIPLFGLYLSVPLLANLKDKIHWFRYGTLIGVIFVVTLPLIFSLTRISYNGALTPNVVNGYILYAMLGYLFSHRELSREKRWLIYGLGILGWVFHFGGTLILSPAGEINQTFKGYLNLPCFLHSCAIFVLLKYITPESGLFIKILDWFSQRTFGIYLVHIYLVWHLPSLLQLDSYSILWRTVGAVVVFFLSAGIIWLMQQIPILKRIVP